MKKTFLALTLVLSLLAAFVAVLPVSAEAVATCTFSEHGTTAGHNTGVVGSSANKALESNGASIHVKPNATGFNARVVDTVETGSRRTKLFALSNPVAAGSYTLEIWVHDPDNVLTAENNNFGVMLTLHGSATTNDNLAYGWNNPDLTAFVGMVVHTANPPAADPARGEMKASYFEYEGNKASFTKTEETKAGINGTTWTKYTADITLTSEVTGVAMWLYQFDSKYTNAVSKQMFIDELTITPKAVETQAPATQAPETQAPATQAPETQAPETQAPATQAPATQAPATQAPATQAPAASDDVTVPPEGDMTAVVALIAVIGTAGVVFATKKKH